MKRLLLFALAILCALNTFSAHSLDNPTNNSKSLIPDENGVIYVKSDGIGNGSSWNNATQDLQGAIETEGVEQVWACKGTYYATAFLPGETDDNMKSFQLKDGVYVYGNFNGDETSINERDQLSIVNKGLGNSVLTTNSNSYHIAVFDTTGYTNETILDGFEITGGNADNISTPPHNFGGGIVLSSNSIVQNCFIHNNQAEIGAGVVLYKGGLIDSCYFISNTASHEGGGIAILYDGTVENSTISNNSASDRGAGIYVEGFSGTIKNCWLTDNQSDDYGAGIYFRDVPSASIQGSYVADNTAGKSGGGIYAYNSSIDIYSCTIVNNEATTGYGGGINSYSDASANIVNSVFIGNTASTGNNIYNCSSGCSTNVSYSGIESGYEGEYNINISSNDFVNSYYYDLYDGIDNVNPPSKCLNSGNNSIVNESDFDLDRNPRISFSKVDMGAFESITCKAYQLTSTVTTEGGIASPEDTSIYFNNSLIYTIKPNTNGALNTVLFNSVDVTDKLQADGNDYTFTVDTIKTNGELSVSFTILPNVDITTSASAGGSISPTSENIEYGSSQIFTLTFDDGYELDEAAYSGTGTVTDNEDGTITLSNVTSSGELSVTFVLKQYEITTSTNTGGSISPTNATIEHGNNQLFTLTFDERYELDEATFSGSGTITDNENGTITLSNVKSVGELAISFAIVSGIDVLENTFSVYPNPTSGLIKIIGLDFLDYAYIISDISGRIMLKDNLSGKEDIDISKLEKGTYILTIKASQTVKSIKLIKIE